ncbi:MAG: lysophospholipid acyltransferase family protein [Steroidobacteraceae bacterium]
MQWLGSVVFTAFLPLWTFCYAIFFVVACSLLPLRRRMVLVRVWARVLMAVLRWTCRLDYVVEGRGNIPAGNHIAVWKHSSSWETVAMALVFPDQAWVLKHELIWIPFVGWGIRQMRAIAIDRSSGASAVNQVVEQGKARLAAGLWLMLFPEGTRMTPGKTRRYGVSAALLASQTGKLLVPVAHDAGYFWPRRGLLKKPGTIHLVIGPAVAPAGRGPREINEELQRWIENEIRRLRSR